MDKRQVLLPVIITVAGLILLLMDLASVTINVRGADSIAGAILLGFGVLALTCRQR